MIITGEFSACLLREPKFPPEDTEAETAQFSSGFPMESVASYPQETTGAFRKTSDSIGSNNRVSLRVPVYRRAGVQKWKTAYTK